MLGAALGLMLFFKGEGLLAENDTCDRVRELFVKTYRVLGGAETRLWWVELDASDPKVDVRSIVDSPSVSAKVVSSPIRLTLSVERSSIKEDPRELSLEDDAVEFGLEENNAEFCVKIDSLDSGLSLLETSCLREGGGTTVDGWPCCLCCSWAKFISRLSLGLRAMPNPMVLLPLLDPLLGFGYSPVFTRSAGNCVETLWLLLGVPASSCKVSSVCALCKLIFFRVFFI